MKRDAWLTHPTSVELVFNTKPEELWQIILREKGLEISVAVPSPGRFVVELKQPEMDEPHLS